MTITIEELEIEPLDRFGLYAFLDLVRVMEPETEKLMVERAEANLAGDDYDSPHSRPWHVSFHGSEFPGVPESACERYLLYRMMNFVSADGAMPPWVTTTGVLGKAGELDIADAWYRGGRLLAVPEDPTKPEQHQLGFVDEDRWMTVSTDLPILPPGWTRPHIVEVKCKAEDVVHEMIEGRILQRPDGSLEKVGRGPDERHAVQLKATIGLAHEYDWGWVAVCRKCWRIKRADVYERLGLPDGAHPSTDAFNYCRECQIYDTHVFKLEPPTTGEIYYWSRSWPRNTKSFYFEHDATFMQRGLEVLESAKQNFVDDVIPDRPPHFQWSVGPCANCNFKRFCRLDAGLAPRQKKPRPENIRRVLSESAGVDHTRTLRPAYDPQASRERVLQEWSK